MACHCHGKNGFSAVRTSPYDQCTACAKKHIVKAWNLWNEFVYMDDNRDVISGQIRNAADHLMYDHREIAMKARDLAVMIEENRDAEITTEWKVLLEDARQAFYADHSDALERLTQLKTNKETLS